MSTPVPPGVDLKENRSSYIHAAVGICLALAILATFARIVSRKIQKQKWITSDYLIIAGLSGAIGEACLIFESVNVGFGRHVQTLSTHQLRKFLELFFAAELFYVYTIASTKISILLLYMSLFPNRTFAVWAKGLGAIVLAWAIACVAGVIFSCNPVNGFWDRSIPSTCIDSTKFFIGNAVPNMVTDTAILVLPVRMVWRLQMSKKRKVAVSGMFLLGSFVIVSSILRLVLLFNEDLNDPTWGLVNAFTWSNIEIDIAVVSANLPVIRPVLQKIWPATMFSKLGTTGRSKEYGGSKDAFALHGFQRQPRDEFQRLPETHVDANSITTLSRDDPEHGVFLPN